MVVPLPRDNLRVYRGLDGKPAAQAVCPSAGCMLQLQLLDVACKVGSAELIQALFSPADVPAECLAGIEVEPEPPGDHLVGVVRLHVSVAVKGTGQGM